LIGCADEVTEIPASHEMKKIETIYLAAALRDKVEAGSKPD
jgi:hypothetical protein